MKFIFFLFFAPNYASAQPILRCAEVFAKSNSLEISNAKPMAKVLKTLSWAAESLPSITAKSILSEDGRYVAIHSSGSTAGAGDHLILFDVETHQRIWERDVFDLLDLQFAGNSKGLVATFRQAEDKVRHLYFLSSLPDLAPVRLQVPETRHGASLENFLWTESSPFALVVRDSANPVGVMKRSQIEPGIDPNIFVYDRGASVLNAKDLSLESELKFGDLYPIAGSISPKGQKAALVLYHQFSQSSRLDKMSLRVIDLAKPALPIWSGDFSFAGSPDLKVLGHQMALSLEHRVRSVWSEDGERVLFYDRNLGKIESVCFSCDTSPIPKTQSALVARQEKQEPQLEIRPIFALSATADGMTFVVRKRFAPLRESPLGELIAPEYFELHQYGLGDDLNAEMNSAKIQDSDFRPQKEGRLFRLQHFIVGVFDKQILTIDLRSPQKDQHLLSLFSQESMGEIYRATQISEDSLRILTSSGVVDLLISP